MSMARAHSSPWLPGLCAWLLPWLYAAHDVHGVAPSSRRAQRVSHPEVCGCSASWRKRAVRNPEEKEKQMFLPSHVFTLSWIYIYIWFEGCKSRTNIPETYWDHIVFSIHSSFGRGSIVMVSICDLRLGLNGNNVAILLMFAFLFCLCQPRMNNPWGCWSLGTISDDPLVEIYKVDILCS